MTCNTFSILATLTWSLLGLLVAPIAAAESLPGWPHIRGANYDGVSIETGLIDSFPASGPTVLWAKELGQGYGSLVAQNNRVYTQYQTLAGQLVLCMSAENGEAIWSYRYDWPFQVTGQYPRVYPTKCGAAFPVFNHRRTSPEQLQVRISVASSVQEFRAEKTDLAQGVPDSTRHRTTLGQ